MSKVDLRSRRLIILALMMVVFTLIYYFGELLDFAGIEAARWKFFYSVHDVHRLFFLAPVIYAGYVFGARAAVIITLISFMIFLPRALVISPFPDPILRTVLFTIIAGVMGWLTGTARKEFKRRNHLEALLMTEKQQLLRLLEELEEGVLIIGPDYRIRFMNPHMIRDFGEGIGSTCYKLFRSSESPCTPVCKLPEVIGGKVERWEYEFPDGRTCEMLASPYLDSDGAFCLIAIFREVAHLKKT